MILKITGMDFLEKETLLGNKKIHYAVTGKGPIVVLVHGWANNWMGWIPLMEKLNKDFTVYAIDQMGFGQSDRIENYSVQIQSDFLAGFIKNLKQKPEAVCGLSLGTFVVADFDLRYPKLTKRAILIGAVLAANKRRTILGEVIQRSLKAINGRHLSETALKKIIEQRLTAYLMAKYFNMYKFNKSLIDTYNLLGRKQMSKEAFIQMGISASAYSLIDTINALKNPVFIIYGSNDKFTNLEQAKKLLREDFCFAKIPQSGHITSLEQPKLVAEKIKKFIQLTV